MCFKLAFPIWTSENFQKTSQKFCYFHSFRVLTLCIHHISPYIPVLQMWSTLLGFVCLFLFDSRFWWLMRYNKPLPITTTLFPRYFFLFKNSLISLFATRMLILVDFWWLFILLTSLNVHFCDIQEYNLSLKLSRLIFWFEKSYSNFANLDSSVVDSKIVRSWGCLITWRFSHIFAQKKTGNFPSENAIVKKFIFNQFFCNVLLLSSFFANSSWNICRGKISLSLLENFRGRTK